jgi:hypothetical protein
LNRHADRSNYKEAKRAYRKGLNIFISSFDIGIGRKRSDKGSGECEQCDEAHNAIGNQKEGFQIPPNVEMIRVNYGAARAPHETRLRKTPDPMIGSALALAFIRKLNEKFASLRHCRMRRLKGAWPKQIRRQPSG